MSLDQPLKPVRDLAKQSFGEVPSLTTLWAWCKRGVTVGDKTVRLNAVKGLRGAWLATEEDWLRFIAERSGTAQA